MLTIMPDERVSFWFTHQVIDSDRTLVLALYGAADSRLTFRGKCGIEREYATNESAGFVCCDLTILWFFWRTRPVCVCVCVCV